CFRNNIRFNYQLLAEEYQDLNYPRLLDAFREILLAFEPLTESYTRIRAFAVFIHTSPQRRKAFKDIQEANQKLLLIQDQQINYLLCLTKPFFNFTNTLSKSKTATIHQKKTVLKALKVSYKKLYRYYRRTINLQRNIYTISTILAPSYKLHQRNSQQSKSRLYLSYYATRIPKEFLINRQSLKTISEIQEHHQEYPVLARIARNTLAIPATGAGVEQMFNYAQDICHYRHRSLKESTISNLIIYIYTSNFKSKADLK
ncbi:hypothetical protein N7509_007492, partial [Penicillium cosmopolitanum]